MFSTARSLRALAISLGLHAVVAATLFAVSITPPRFPTRTPRDMIVTGEVYSFFRYSSGGYEPHPATREYWPWERCFGYGDGDGTCNPNIYSAALQREIAGRHRDCDCRFYDDRWLERAQCLQRCRNRLAWSSDPLFRLDP